MHLTKTGQLWRQYVIAGIANISIASTGFCMGWTSPVNEILGDRSQSPLPGTITSEQEAWIGSLVTIGAIFGPFLGGFLASRVGRKWALLVSSIPMFIGWLFIAMATDVGMLYTGRIFWGLATGMMFTISPMYCAEIATDEDRGALGSFLQAFCTLGFLVVYSVGPFVSYAAISYVGVALVVVFDICFIFMPESPFYHLTKNDRASAAASLATVRGRPVATVQPELDKMAADVAASLEKKASLKDLLKRGNVKAMYISCALFTFQQLSSVDAVLFYLSNIFRAAGSMLDAAYSSIIIGAVQVIASFITPFVVDRLGRRILLLMSSCGSAVGLGLLGFYFLLSESQNPLTGSIGFLPVLSLVLFILAFALGLGSVPWAVMTELFPMEVKAIAAPIATAFCWILCFLVTRFFQPLADAIGMSFTFWIFGGFCVASFFFTLFVVPETKGKTFQEIQDLLNDKTALKTTKSVKE